MAGRVDRAGLLSHRSAQGESERRDRRDEQRLRDAFPHPAGGGASERSGDRHRRAVYPQLGAGAQDDPEEGYPARHRQPRGHFPLSGRVLQPGPVDQGCDGARRCCAHRHFQFRATRRTRQGQGVARRQRPACGDDRRLALAIRLRAACLRYSRRTAPRHRHRALPHRRRAASGLSDSHGGAERHDQPHQDSRPHGRGGKASPAGRAHQDACAEWPGDRAAPVRPCRLRSAKSW